MSGVTPTESDFAIRKRNQAMVGEGHAMGIAAQILEHKEWATEGTLRIDHPIGTAFAATRRRSLAEPEIADLRGNRVGHSGRRV